MAQKPAGPAAGQLIDVGGHTMHIRCAGPANGTPTVILEAGGGGFQQLYLSRKTNPVPFGDRPLIVLGAGKRPAPPGTSDELWAQMRIEKDGQKIDLSRLSNNSRFVLDPNSTHAIHIDNPELVARSIREVVTAVSSGARLVP